MKKENSSKEKKIEKEIKKEVPKKKEKIAKEKKVSEKKEKIEKIKKEKTGTVKKVVKTKSFPKNSKRQRAFAEKKARLAVKARQTKWAPVWVVIKKYGVGKRIHPSATTKHRRSWRRTKLKMKPRRIRKRHMG